MSALNLSWTHCPASLLILKLPSSSIWSTIVEEMESTEQIRIKPEISRNMQISKGQVAMMSKYLGRTVIRQSKSKRGFKLGTGQKDIIPYHLLISEASIG